MPTGQPNAYTSPLTGHPLYSEYIQWKETLLGGGGGATGQPLIDEFRAFQEGARRRQQLAPPSTGLPGGVSTMVPAQSRTASLGLNDLRLIAGAGSAAGRAGLNVLQGQPSGLTASTLGTIGGGVGTLGGFLNTALGGPPEVSLGLQTGGQLASALPSFIPGTAANAALISAP